MLTHVARRAVVQRRLLAALVVLVAAAATLVGVCTLLVGVTSDRAFGVQVEHSPARDVDVTAYLVEVPGPEVTAARKEARRVVGDILAPMRPTITSTATSRMRRLGDTDRLGYLMTADAIDDGTDLTSGRWPSQASSGPVEAVLPDTTADLLGVGLGDELTLGREIGLNGVDSSVTVVVVGTIRPGAGVEWEADPLAGAGFVPAYSDGGPVAPAYGPFVVADAPFLSTGSTVRGLRVVAHPTLSLADDRSLEAAVGSLEHASPLLASRVGDGADITRVASELPRTLDEVRAQQAGTRATVLVVLLLGTALSLAAVLLAGWLLASVRVEERALLSRWGVSRRQQLAAAVVEAMLLAAAAAAVAVPAAAVAHSRLTHLPDLSAAGLSQAPTVTTGLVLTVLAVAVLLTVALVTTGFAAGSTPAPAGRRGALAHLGVDVALLAMAAFAWGELRSQADTPETAGDLTLILAPVLCVTALTVVAVRLVPLLLARVAAVGTRARGVVLPLAAQQAARRPHAGTAMVLVAAAVAASVFGLGLRATWETSQDDQAALRVGTDLSLTLPAPAGMAEASTLADALRDLTPGPIVSAVIHRPMVLGSYVGQQGSRPVLVAVDTRDTGHLLRGRTTPGTTWAEVGRELAPRVPVRGVALPAQGAGVELEGRAPSGVALTATPTAIVQDPAGFRSSVPAAPLPLDGRPHAVEWRTPVGTDLRLIGLRLEVEGALGEGTRARAPVEITLALPGPTETTETDRETDAEPDGETGDAPWRLASVQRDTPVGRAVASTRPTRTGTELRTTFDLDLPTFAYTGAVVLAAAFPAATEVPVAVSEELAAAVGADVGEELSAIVDGTVLLLRVAVVVPAVPSAPGEIAVLADADMLTRALIEAGRLDPVVDGWWVARPTEQTVRALEDTGLGELTSREDVAAQLARGPLRVTVPAVLLALVAVAVVMLLAGVVLVLSGERQRRSADVLRLRALGLSRRDARRLLLAEHTAFLVPLVLVGALVGALATASIGPHLVRSDIGGAPVPPAVVAWPWTAQVLLVSGLLVGSLVVSALVTALHVRRSDPVHLREGDA